MANLQTTNNASTTIAAGISSSATSVTLASGTGVEFPAISGSQYFRATFVKAGAPGTFEIVKVTARSVDTCTIVRAQEGTTAQNWALDDYFNLFLTAADVSAFVQFEDLQAQAGNYAVDTGAANAYVVALSPTLTAHVTGLPIRWKAANSSTGASTFNEGGGNGSLTTPNGSALQANDIVAGGVYESVWDGAKFQTITVQRTNFNQLAGSATAAQVPNANGVQGTLSAGNFGYVVAFLEQASGPGNILYSASFTFNPAAGLFIAPNVVATNIISAGAAISGGILSGDITANRGGNQGAIFLGSNTSYLYFNAAYSFGGTATVNGTAFNSTCDERLKTNIKPIHDALELVCSWNGVTFDWNDLYPSKSGERSVGLLAGDVKKGLPEAISTFKLDPANAKADDPEYLNVNAMGPVAALVESTKILANMVKTLTARVEELESQLT